MSAERESENSGNNFPSWTFFSDPTDPHTGAQLLVSRVGVADLLSASLVAISIYSGQHPTNSLPSQRPPPPPSLLVFPPLLVETLCTIWDFGVGLASTGDNY